MYARVRVCLYMSAYMSLVDVCMYARVHVYLHACLHVRMFLKQHSSTGRVLLLPEGPKTRMPMLLKM